MRVGLIDVDGHRWPNLCLMKLSAYHKGRGDGVGWHKEGEDYDLVYMSQGLWRGDPCRAGYKGRHRVWAG